MSTRLEIDERHEVVVPCGAGPQGKHRVWVYRAPRMQLISSTDAGSVRKVERQPVHEIVRIESECSGPAGDAVLRLGGECCLAVVENIRATVKTGKGFNGTGRELLQELPEGIRAIVERVRSDGAMKREHRAPESVDGRPLLIRLLEKQARRLSRMPLDASIKDGVRRLSIKHYSEYIIATKPPGGRWQLAYDKVEHVASDLGKGRVGHEERCFVCPKQEGRVFDNVRLHTRHSEHRGNVRRVLLNTLNALPNGWIYD